MRLRSRGGWLAWRKQSMNFIWERIDLLPRNHRMLQEIRRLLYLTQDYCIFRARKWSCSCPIQSRLGTPTILGPFRQIFAQTIEDATFASTQLKSSAHWAFREGCGDAAEKSIRRALNEALRGRGNHWLISGERITPPLPVDPRVQSPGREEGERGPRDAVHQRGGGAMHRAELHQDDLRMMARGSGQTLVARQ